MIIFHHSLTINKKYKDREKKIQKNPNNLHHIRKKLPKLQSTEIRIEKHTKIPEIPQTK